jgi:hypothetical protein
MKKNFLFILLFLLSLVPLVGLLPSGLPTTHDGQDHVARIANFYQNLQEGILIPRWSANLNWGYGHPVMIFLYPLPSYFASLFHFLGFSFVASTKLVFAFAFVLSMLTMYLWLKSFLSKKAAVVGALLYGFAPYHFVDLYVRGAIGELVAFIFPPLLLYFVFRLSHKQTYFSFVGGAVSLAGFILAHNAVSLMFLPVIGFYIFYQFLQISGKKNKRNFLLQCMGIGFFGFSLAAFFWLPAYMEGKYTLRDIVTKDIYQDRFVSLQQLFYGPWNYGESGTFTVQVGLFQWLAVLLATVGLFHHKANKKEWFFTAGLLVIFIVALFLMTPASKMIWENVSLLQKFQFPWRLLAITMFVSSVLGAFVFSVLSKKWQTLGLGFIIIFLLLTTKDMWFPKDYLQKPEAFYTSIYNGTTDTGESSPVWSIRFMEKTPKSAIQVIGGQAEITQGQRTITSHSYSINASEKTQVRENTVYFPGWEVLVDGVRTPIQFQDTNNRGVITFFVEKGSHEVIVQFKETRLRQSAGFISVASLCLLLILSILGKKRLWQN